MFVLLVGLLMASMHSPTPDANCGLGVMTMALLAPISSLPALLIVYRTARHLRRPTTVGWRRTLQSAKIAVLALALVPAIVLGSRAWTIA